MDIFHGALFFHILLLKHSLRLSRALVSAIEYSIHRSIISCLIVEIVDGLQYSLDVTDLDDPEFLEIPSGQCE